MTAVIRRRGPIAAVAVALGLVVSACGSGPSQANAAAIVGDRTISVDRVQDLVDKAVADVPSVKALADERKLDIVSRAVLRQLVLHELLADYGTKHDLSVDPADVSALAQQIRTEEAPNGRPPTADVIAKQAVDKVFDASELASDRLKLAKLGRELGPKLKITLDYTVIAPEADSKPGSLHDQAVGKAKEIAEAGLSGSGAVFDKEKEANRQVQTNKEFYAVAAPLEDLETLIYGTSPNNAFALQVNGEQTFWVVGLIRARDENATFPEGPEGEAPEFDLARATALGIRLLQPTADTTSITISPRYGVWDPAAMGIAPSKDETAGTILPLRTTTSP